MRKASRTAIATWRKLEVRAGRLARARAYAEEGIAMAGREDALGFERPLFARALVAAHEGDADLARKHTARGLSMAEEWATETLRFCSIACSDFSGPVARQSGRSALSPRAAAGASRAPGYPGAARAGRVLSDEDAIEAMIGAGRVEEAEARLEAWEELGARYTHRATDRFKTSRSIRSWAFSDRSRFNSATSSVESPWAPSRSPRSPATQLPRVPALISRSRAISAIDLPDSRTIRTAPSLNS